LQLLQVLGSSQPQHQENPCFLGTQFHRGDEAELVVVDFDVAINNAAANPAAADDNDTRLCRPFKRRQRRIGCVSITNSS